MTSDTTHKTRQQGLIDRHIQPMMTSLIPRRRRKTVLLVVVLGLLALVYFVTGSGESRTQSDIHAIQGHQMDAAHEQKDNKTLKVAAQPAVARELTFDEEQQERLLRIKAICSDTSKPPGNIHTLLSKHNLTYCMVPRSDNTFWLQVYRFLNHDYIDSDVKTPLDLNVRLVHSRGFARTKKHMWRRLKEMEKKELLATKVFMSVRDPYERLWSTFLHTMLLPELWHTTGVKLEKNRTALIKKNQKKQEYNRCGMDITFAEFINYILNAFEPDFLAYHQMCDPCQLQPTYIIKQETLLRDRRRVLGELGLGDMAWRLTGEEFVKNKVKTTVSEAFAVHKEQHIQRCATHGDILRRLWKSFIVHGDIPEDAPEPSFSDIHEVNFTNHIMAVRARALAQGWDGKTQRRKFLVAAFRNLKPATLHSIVKRFGMDFKLFGYDPMPVDIFTSNSIN